MKLRNKKTGEIIELLEDRSGNTLSFEYDGGKHFITASFNSLAELNEDWEDYTPAEPLINDEKIRKIVRAWAEGYKIKVVQYDAFWNGLRSDNSTITLWKELPLVDHYDYSITELCGEEEE